MTLCDTNGATLPHEVAAATAEVVAALGGGVGIHCHNDAESASPTRSPPCARAPAWCRAR